MNNCIAGRFEWAGRMSRRGAGTAAVKRRSSASSAPWRETPSHACTARNPRIASLVLSFSIITSLHAVVEASDAKFSTFVNQHCADCHGESDPEAGLRIDSLKFDLSTRNTFSTWAMIHGRVAKGEMPPADADQPKKADKAEFLAALSEALTEADRKRQHEFGRSELRRLSRVEYANSLKDILDLPHLEIEDKLPPDAIAHGYPKSAKALDFSHVMVSRYLEVADYALRQALAPRASGMKRELVRAELNSVDGVKNTLQTLYVQLKQTTGMPLIGTKLDPTLDVYSGNFQKREPGYVRDPEPHFDGVATFMHSRSNHNIVMKPFKVKQSGYYLLRVHGWGLLNDHGKLLPSDRTETVAFYSPTGRLMGRCDVPPNKPTTGEVTVWLNEGEPVEYLAISAPNEKFQTPNRDGKRYDRFKAYGIGLQWFEMDGPVAVADLSEVGLSRTAAEGPVTDGSRSATWPPLSHRHLLANMKLESTERQPNGLEYRVVTDDPINDARRLLRRFAARAYRRPARDEDVLIPMQMVRPRLRRKEPFVEALLAGYRAILTSPEFLLLNEQPGKLDAWALANRLSFFLWNSPPDAELRKVAASGELLNDAELRRQTERLLERPKSQRFVEHFLDYWLDLRHITLTQPDENLYPEYNGLLAESMVEETRAFFSEMIRGDLGVDHVYDSDFLMINQRLAKLYLRGGDWESGRKGEGKQGRKGDKPPLGNSPSPVPPLSQSPVHGSHIRKVPIASDSVRGGLLTQGSLLKITANGTTTSPVVRGTFALTRLLGDPPPPPPASVSAIEPDITGATTIREQLARHRSDPACASCHQKIDPPGFALESFDVMGAWRSRYRASLEHGEKGVDLQFNGKPAQYKIGLDVDSAGQLPDGSEFADINGFREQLRSRKKHIARNLLEQFIVYSTGTPVGFADQALVDDIMESLAGKDFGIRSMIHKVVQSDLFRRK